MWWAILYSSKPSQQEGPAAPPPAHTEAIYQRLLDWHSATTHAPQLEAFDKHAHLLLLYENAITALASQKSAKMTQSIRYEHITVCLFQSFIREEALPREMKYYSDRARQV